jgi:hypothetical protein
MSSKTAGGLVLIVVGAATALWGVNYLSSLASRFGRAVGLQDNTGYVALGVGGLFCLIGFIVAISPSNSGPGYNQNSHPLAFADRRASGSFCSRCGAGLKDQARFCEGCGRPVG